MTVAESTFPVSYLDGCETALVVFAAAFGGVQDAAFIRDAGLRAVCVDDDRDALSAMRHDYPETWEFRATDAFAFLDAQLSGRGLVFGRFDLRWDVVTLDPFHGHMMSDTIARLPDFARLARKVLIVGTDRREITPPEGWRIRTKHWRTAHEGGTYWTVLERSEL